MENQTTATTGSAEKRWGERPGDTIAFAQPNSMRELVAELVEQQNSILGRVSELRDRLVGAPPPVPSVSPSDADRIGKNEPTGNVVSRDLHTAKEVGYSTLAILSDLGGRI